MNQLLAFLIGTAVAFVPPPSNAGRLGSEAVEVDVQLVLAADISGSMSASLKDAQRLGFVVAFLDRSLQQAIMSGPLGRIAVSYFEWAGNGDQRLIVPWTVLATPEDMARFAKSLQSGPTQGNGSETSISGAMVFARQLFQESGFASKRKVVDISSNGRNSQGTDLALALEALFAIGATVNGLVLSDSASGQNAPYSTIITEYDGPLIDYYRNEVIGGPGAFAIEVDPSDGFSSAILRKLVMEIASAGFVGTLDE